MTLDAQAIEKIQGMAIAAAEKAVINDGNDTFLVSTDGVTRFVKDDSPRTIYLHTLDGLVGLIQGESLMAPVSFLNVVGPDKVLVYGVIDKFGNRPLLAEVTPFTETMQFGNFFDQEKFQILMRSTFVQNNHRDIVIEFSGKLEEQDASSYSDDGLAQSAVVKSGIASKASANVPSPVMLRPYRTFIEIEQPESEFILRIRKGAQLALFEADGNAWKNEAIANVQKYLVDKLGTSALVVG